MNKPKSSRQYWVNYAKGIAIILVVYRHALIGIQRADLYVNEWLIDANEIVYSFRMPLFFIISGMFISKSINKRKGNLFIGYKVDTILYPYFVWGALQITIQIILSNYTNADRGVVDYTYLLTEPRRIDQMWYLFALFNVSILFYALYCWAKIRSWGLIIIALIMYGSSVWVSNYSLIHDLLYYFLFLVFGHLVSSYLLNADTSFYTYKSFIILTPLFWFTQWYWLSHQDIGIYLFAVISLIGATYIFSISFILAKHNILLFIRMAGKYSLQIYLIHVMVVAAVRIGFIRVLSVEQPVIILFIAWIMGVFVPIFVYRHIVKGTKIDLLFRGRLFS